MSSAIEQMVATLQIPGEVPAPKKSRSPWPTEQERIAYRNRYRLAWYHAHRDQINDARKAKRAAERGEM